MNRLVYAAMDCGISPFRAHLSQSLYSRYGTKIADKDEDLFWLLCHLAVQAGSGHLRTDLHKIEEESQYWLPEKSEISQRLAQKIDALIKIGLDNGLIGQLQEQGATADSLELPRPPLILTDDRRYLYFLRRRRQEDQFLQMLSDRIAPATDPATVPDEKSTPVDRLVALLTAGKKLILLSGGPGTGKTTAIKNLLPRLKRENPSIQVILTAPTGRAASRLAESIPGHSGRTLHNLLGLLPGQAPRLSAKNPLEANLVVLDEASMVDLTMINHLLRAMMPQTALLMVGDPDQLPSVEAGTLLGDLLFGDSAKAGPLSDCIVQLTRNYRSEKSGILEAAAAVREGDFKRLIAAADGESVQIQPLKRSDEMIALLTAEYKKWMGDMGAFSVLSPLRQGIWGVQHINREISLLAGKTSLPFENMPIVITRNDPSRELWNGDRGIVIKTDGRLQASFQADKKIPLSLLPAWEPAWVQTIHKSQGSEFRQVAIILPDGAEKLLSREILYTAITRARDKVMIFLDPGVMEKCLIRRVVRHSRIRRWASGL